MLPAALALTAAVSTPTAASKDDACFRSHDFESYRPIDNRSFYMRLRSNEIIRVELQGVCPQMLFPQAFMNMDVRGDGLVCGPVDWSVSFSQPGAGGFPTPCIVRSQHRLTPEEVTALPRRDRP